MHPVSSISSYENNFAGARLLRKRDRTNHQLILVFMLGKDNSALAVKWSLAGVKQGARKLPSDTAHSASSLSEVRLQVRLKGRRALGNCLQSRQAHDGILEK